MDIAHRAGGNVTFSATYSTMEILPEPSMRWYSSAASPFFSGVLLSGTLVSPIFSRTLSSPTCIVLSSPVKLGAAPRPGADGGYDDTVHSNILSQHKRDRSAVFRRL